VLTLALVGLNVVCFLVELSLGSQADAALRRWGLVPADVLSSPAAWITLVTSLFLHAGWLHLLFNVLYLAVFGMGVERLLGTLRFGLLYLISGLSGGLAYVAAQSAAEAPAVGASGAIAGVIAASLVLQPRVALGAVFGYLPTSASLPTLVLLIVWLLSQLLSGVASIAATTGIAWWAHLGGFLAGLVVTSTLRSGRSRG
jgi:rhomboid family protein